MAANDEFSWGTRSMVAVPEQEPIAVYMNPANRVVLRFHDSCDQEDRWVVIDPLNVDRLCEALQAVKLEALMAQQAEDANTAKAEPR